MDAVLTYLESLSPATLYVALAVAAMVENVVPPLPTDAIIACGSFLAARGRASVFGVFLSTWTGNVIGACVVYAVFRRIGWRDTIFTRASARWSPDRLRAIYDRGGGVALALSRFIPGARALIPPLAGALRVPAWSFTTIVALASAVWYGALTTVAYGAGANWEALQARVATLVSRWTLAALVFAAALAVAWWVLRKRRAG
ncbi:MAG TPA: DedA family protein [Gemmatimonadaceae bacterium]|nr:DedA family protein [Gemmatimonadaceae bacterium]